MGTHTYEWVIDKEATTTSTGLKHLECKVCKKALPSEVISKVSENTTTKTKKKIHKCRKSHSFNNVAFNVCCIWNGHCSDPF
ncbi:hypothetical protein [Floccifex porci]|uniref:Uncharacterized protein n=1 Tax=Floccifex porci TaxID=2606629 RepID=A0A7X2N3N2_9FIRM|nr:hypothetical protein [Floccifex porci]MSS01869.1 hypothetical protein [Floccifex porci]